ncbi:MAG: potassium channel family protein [Pseudomonadota bacterium]|nr:potassium channel family protein [Pseudomonadota bacterium]
MFDRPPPRRPDEIMLRRRSRRAGWYSIAWRVAAVLSLLVFVVMFHWFERHGLEDELDGHVSFLDAIYFTMISATTTGYGDIVPITDRTRMFDALIVTPIRIFLVLIFVGTAYLFVARRSWERWTMARLQKNLKNHIVLAGYGTSGSDALDELLARGCDPSDVVVIDCNSAALARAEALGCNVLEADATRDKTLQAVHVERARAIIISAGRDDTSILITLTARHLAENVPISIAVRNADNELLARQAGANTVINPVSFAGLLLAGSTHGEHIADYIADLASHTGRVRLAERRVRDQECGRPLAEVSKGIGLRLYRGNRPYGFWEPEAKALQPGDVIVEILPTTQQEGGAAEDPAIAV